MWKRLILSLLPNQLTKGIRFKENAFDDAYDEYSREDILNLAEEGPFDEWEAVQKTIVQFYHNQFHEQNPAPEKIDMLQKIALNRFINIGGSMIIQGKKNGIRP